MPPRDIIAYPPVVRKSLFFESLFSPNKEGVLSFHSKILLPATETRYASRISLWSAVVECLPMQAWHSFSSSPWHKTGNVYDTLPVLSLCLIFTLIHFTPLWSDSFTKALIIFTKELIDFTHNLFHNTHPNLSTFWNWSVTLEVRPDFLLMIIMYHTGSLKCNTYYKYIMILFEYSEYRSC